MNICSSIANDCHIFNSFYRYENISKSTRIDFQWISIWNVKYVQFDFERMKGAKNVQQMKIDGCMTENCQNYLSLEVVQNEKSFRANGSSQYTLSLSSWLSLVLQ